MKALLLLLALGCWEVGHAQTWTQSGTDYYLTVGSSQIKVESAYGARISSFTLNGNQFFFVGSGMRGTTFWLSPESVYSSFPAVLDTGAYSASLQNGNSNLVLTSAIDAGKTGFQVIKNIRGNNADNSISVTYTLVNKSGGTKSAAPWELTRVPANGLTFFPKASNWSYNPGNPPPFPPVLETSSMVWVQHQSVEGQKLFRDGAEGWIAHVHSGMIFITQYPDVLTNNFAPQESDVELWSSSGLEEVEQQGPYTSLANNASLDWTVKWFLRSIPANVPATVGSASLLRLARDINATGCNGQIVSFPTIPNKSRLDVDFLVSATASSGLPVTFSVVSGPATVTSNTVHLTGVTGTVVIGAQQPGNNQHCFTESVNSFLVTDTPPTPLGWAVDASGNWSTAANWDLGQPAGGIGSTGYFGLNLTADRFVTNDAPRTVGHLTFGDVDSASAGGWSIVGGSVLTLQTSNGLPAVNVNALGANESARISCPLDGTQGLTKNGIGTLILTGNNTYTGDTTINGATGTGTSTVAVMNSSFETPVIANWAYQNTSGGNTFNFNAAAGFGWTLGTSAGLDHNSGTWYPAGAPAADGVQAAFIQGNSAGAAASQSVTFPITGTYTISFGCMGRNPQGPNDIQVRVDGATIGTIGYAAQSQSAWQTYNVSYNCTLAGNHTLAFVGARGGGDYSSCLDKIQIALQGTTTGGRIALGHASGLGAAPNGLVVNTNGSLDLAGYSPTVTGISGSGMITNSSAAAAMLTIKVNDQTNGPIIAGLINVVIASNSGKAFQTLDRSCSYTGTTTVSSNSTLLIRGSLTGVGAVTVAGGMLGGDGVIRGPVTVQAGGTLSPGTSIGTLSISNALMLMAGSTTSVEVNAQTQAKDLVQGVTLMSYNGNLVVSNLAGTLAAGQSFKLFSTGNSGGNFASITPSPGAGLGWSFNPTNGTLSVIALLTPQFTQFSMAGDGSFTMSGTGPAASSYRIFATTNIVLSFSNWTPVATGAFSGEGVFSFTDPNATGDMKFYRVSQP